MSDDLGYEAVRVDRAWPFIDRAYRESLRLQWGRETAVNAIQAGARQIEFGVEWQGVATDHVYRRIIADNGCGMDDAELRRFFRTHGGSGKLIGPRHENFGVGAKSSLFPWNPAGLIVTSWKNGIGSMIWVRLYGETEDDYEFGLRRFPVADEDGNLTTETVCAPGWDEELGIDLSEIRPSWMKNHDGTVLLLLGSSLDEDTMLGDPSRVEGKSVDFPNYMNRRFWDIPDQVDIKYYGQFVKEKDRWPLTNRGGADDAIRPMIIKGARHFIERTDLFADNPVESGTETLSDGTRVHWYLHGEDFHTKGTSEYLKEPTHAEYNGYVACLYKNEVYDLLPVGTRRDARARTFGIYHTEVQKRVWLLVEPPLYENGVSGVYPETSRNRLLYSTTTGDEVAMPLPWYRWGEEFANNPPTAIRDALHKARAVIEHTEDDKRAKRELDRKFSVRWRAASEIVQTRRTPGRQSGNEIAGPIQRIRTSTTTTTTTNGTGVTVTRTRQTQQTNQQRRSRVKNRVAKLEQTIKQGREQGAVIPEVEFIGRTNDDNSVNTNFEAGMAAYFVRHAGEDYECGVIFVDRDYPVIAAAIKEQRERYSARHWDEIEKKVQACYKVILQAAAAHAQFLGNIIPAELCLIDKPEAADKGGMLSPAALTACLLGEVTQSAYISTQVGGAFGRRSTTPF